MAVRRSTTLGERELFAEYPFLPGAESLVADFSPSLRDLITHPSFERARELGRARIRAAADDPSGATGVGELPHASLEERFLSFLYARLLLSTISTLAPIRRWAVAESKLGWARLRSAPPAEVIEVARRLEYELKGSEQEILVRVPDYLRLASPIREGDFRLVRQGVRSGQVHLSRERAIRLLQEGIRGTLALPIEVDEGVRGLLAEREVEFLADIAQRMPAPTPRTTGGVGPLKPEAFPPCIRKMRSMLQASENLSHSGRFALAAFLHRAGASFETIVDAYRGAPDFDEGVTRYQVENITHHAAGRGYEPPECATLRAHGLCFRDGDPSAPIGPARGKDTLCHEPTLKHPLQYYRKKGGTVVERDDPGRPRT